MHSTVRYWAVADRLPRIQRVESSSIDAIGYDSATCRLYVRFVGSRTYVYEDVPESVYDEFMAADSKGRFHNFEIKNAYSYRRL